MKAATARTETIRAVVSRGGTLVEAARLCGMRPQHAWRLARKMGLTRRDRAKALRAAELEAYWSGVDPSVISRPPSEAPRA